MRIIVDRNLQLDGTETIFDDGGDIWIYTLKSNKSSAQILRDRGAVLIDLQGNNDHEQIHWMMRDLASREINSVHCECGPVYAGALLEAGVVNQLVVYQASCLLGDQGRPLFCVEDRKSMQERFDLTLNDYRRFDQDSRMIFSLE